MAVAFRRELWSYVLLDKPIHLRDQRTRRGNPARAQAESTSRTRLSHVRCHFRCAVMAYTLPPGLTPSEVAFLCEMELVSIVPRQRLDSLDLLGVS